MPTIQLNKKVNTNFEEVLSGISELELTDIEKFMKELALVVARKKAPALSGRETQLFLAINKPFNIELQKRYKVLRRKFDSNTLTSKEHEELLNINSKWDTFDLERLKKIIELAQLKNMPVDEFMEKHGLKKPENAL